MLATGPHLGVIIIFTLEKPPFIGLHTTAEFIQIIFALVSGITQSGDSALKSDSGIVESKFTFSGQLIPPGEKAGNNPSLPGVTSLQ